MKRTISLLILLVAAFLATASLAGTWRVEQDGSGDFLTIQPAADAAASGDTILVGPGRYTEGDTVVTAGWTEFVNLVIRQEELTIIGAGSEETIIGPMEPYDESQGRPTGVVGGSFFGNDRFSIEQIGFENLGMGIDGSSPIDRAVLKGCRFESNGLSVRFFRGGYFEANRCVFRNTTITYLLNVLSQEQVIVTGCDFTLEEAWPQWQNALHVEGCEDVEVSNCVFREGAYGLSMYSGYLGRPWIVRDCTFVGQSSKGITLNYLDCLVENCAFEQQNTAIGLAGARNSFTLNQNQILDVELLSIEVLYLTSLTATNSVLAHGEEYTIRQTYDCEKDSPTKLPVLNLTNNDWGTADPDTIASWIHLCDYEAEFIPIMGQVANEQGSLGGFKSMFR